MNVKSHHPLTEVIAKKLSGFSTVDNLEQYRMISRAAAAAVKWHEEQNTHCLLFSQYSLDRKMFPFHVCEQKQEIESNIRDMIHNNRGDNVWVHIHVGTYEECHQAMERFMKAMEID